MHIFVLFRVMVELGVTVRVRVGFGLGVGG